MIQNSMNVHVEDADRGLLQAAVDAAVGSHCQIEGMTSLPIEGGMSGSAIRRYEIALDDTARPSMRFVVKQASHHERRVCMFLYQQGHAGIPFYHTLDLASAGPALLCSEDLGDIVRPHVLAPIDERLLRAEADRLAAIHCANLGRAEQLAWLPRVDRLYTSNMLEQRTFWPHWNAVREDPAFVQRFGRLIAPVEAAAATIIDEMEDVHADGDTLTLIHTDINPSNVRVVDGQPFFIDWETAHYGSLFLDIPHHYPTLELAQTFRSALAEHGLSIPIGTFAEAYRIAARYTALRYIWWTLEAWREDHDETAWVEHYLGMIVD